MSRRSFRIGRLACVLALALTWLPAGAAVSSVFDSGLPFEVSAQRIEYEGELLVADGQVRISQGANRIEADWIAFNNATGQGVASGHVVLIEGSEVLHAAFVEFAVDTVRGFVLRGHYDTGPGGFIVSADQLTRTGEDTYEVSEARFTTCRCPDDDVREPWAIETEEADMTLGGYAVTKNTKITILDVPLIWLPRMIFPVKTERESGLLFPELDFSSRNGVDVGLPIFWAARENLNVRLTPRYLSDRGPKVDLAVQALHGERSYSNLFSSYIYDTEIRDSLLQPFSEHRWVAKLRHDQDLPWKLRTQADLNFVSDNQYVVDFNEMRRHRPDRFLESVAHVGRNFASDGRFSAIGSFHLADDLQNTDDIDRDKYMLQRLPELSGSALTGSLGPIPWFVASLDADYTYFTWRSNPFQQVNVAPTDPLVVNQQFIDIGIGAIPVIGGATIPTAGAGNGVFDEGEPMADRGGRVLIYPRLGLPLRIADTLDLYSEVGYQQLLYDSHSKGFRERGMITAKVDLATRLRATLDLPFLPDLEHTFEPRLTWAFARPSRQADNPLYIPATRVPQTRLRQLSLENVLLDPADRVLKANRLRLAFQNRYHRAGPDGAARSLWADFTLSADYDFAQQRFGTVVLDGHAYPSFGPTTRFVFGYDIENARIDEGMINLSTPLPYLASLGVGYRYLRRIPRFFEAFRSPDDLAKFDRDFMRVNQFDVSVRLPLSQVARGLPWLPRFTLAYSISYSFEGNLRLGNVGSIEYRSKCNCWAVGVDIREDRVRGAEVRFRYTILGLGDDRLGGSVLEYGPGGLFGN